MKAFLKENAVLVAGITLPLVLTLFFFVATTLDKSSTADPTQKVLYLGSNNTGSYYNRAYSVIIKNKKAYLSYAPPANNQHRNHNATPYVYLFDPATNTAELIDLPDLKEGEEKQEVLIEELSHFRFTPNNISEDGYIFERSYRRSGNLMTEMFGGGYRGGKRSFVLRKDSKAISVPNTAGYNARFIGWVIAENK